MLRNKETDRGKAIETRSREEKTEDILRVQSEKRTVDGGEASGTKAEVERREDILRLQSEKRTVDGGEASGTKAEVEGKEDILRLQSEKRPFDRGEASGTKSRDERKEDILRFRLPFKKLIPCLTTDHPKTKNLKKIIKDYEATPVNNYMNRIKELNVLHEEFDQYIINGKRARYTLNYYFRTIRDLKETSVSIKVKDNEIIKAFTPYYVVLHHDNKKIRDPFSEYTQSKLEVYLTEKRDLMKKYKYGIEKLLRDKALLDRLVVAQEG